MKKIIIILIIMFFFLFCEKKKEPKAISGEINLKNWNFEEKKFLDLDGEWEFYWQEFPEIENGKLILNEKNKRYINLPGIWNNYKIDEKKIGSNGYATYRLKILLSEKKQLRIKIPPKATAYKLYLDNDLILEQGEISKEKKFSEPKKSNIYINLNSNRNEIALTFLISNFEQNRGGFAESISLGTAENINKYQNDNIAIDLFICGILFMMGFYHFFLFYLRQNDKSTLHFALFCSFFFLRKLTTDELYLNNLFNISYNIFMTLQYFSVYFGILFFNEYISIMYSEESINKLKIFFRTVFALLSLNVLFLSPYYFTKTQNILEFFLFLFILYICYLLYKAIKNKKENSKKMFMAFFVFGSLVINDILYNNNVVNTDLYGPYGFVIFIFAQSFFVSRRFSQAFKETKDLSENLKKSNEELKNAKEEMTKAYKELEESQKKLFQSDKMITLGAMLAGVAHEINTPLSAIKANAENISEALKNLINKLDIEKNPLTVEDLNVAIKILNLCKTENSVFSSKEIRMAKKKVISLLEKRNHNNIDLLAEMIVELGLTEIFEKDEIILNSNNLEKHLSLVSDIYGIRKKSKVIQTSTDRVSKIVKSLKSFSHFEEDEKKQLVNISENIENVLVILHNKIKMGIEVIKNYQKDLPLILCYQDELTQVWTNLIHNAIQAMNEKGKLEIEIEIIEELKNKFDIDKRNFSYNGKYIKVSIQDSGCGIPNEIKPKIFEAFFTTKPAGEGSGLGLHIIGKILENHNGMLSLESQPGKTKFSIFLPIQN